MSKVVFIAEIVARMVLKGSVTPSTVDTEISRSTRERVVRVLVKEKWFKHHPDLRGVYIPGPRLRDTVKKGSGPDLVGSEISIQIDSSNLRALKTKNG